MVCAYITLHTCKISLHSLKKSRPFNVGVIDIIVLTIHKKWKLVKNLQKYPSSRTSVIGIQNLISYHTKIDIKQNVYNQNIHPRP